jgi:hypothetical protein
MRTSCMFGVSTFQGACWWTSGMAVARDLLGNCSCVGMAYPLVYAGVSGTVPV